MCNKYIVGLDNGVEWHQKEFLTWILDCWCKAAMHLNRAVEVSAQTQDRTPPVQTFPRRAFLLPRHLSRNHQSEQHLGCCKGCISMGSRHQSSDSRSHSAVFPIANGFHPSSSIPQWCNGCKLTKRPIFRYCWLSRSTSFSRPFALISCASSKEPLKAMIVQHVLRDASHLNRASAIPTRRSEIATAQAIFTISSLKGSLCGCTCQSFSWMWSWHQVSSLILYFWIHLVYPPKPLDLTISIWTHNCKRRSLLSASERMLHLNRKTPAGTSILLFHVCSF